MVRWGMIGCGKVTEVKSGPGLRKAEGSTVAAVMRRDAEKARDYAQRHGIPFWTTDADELIAHPTVDAVYIATPPGSHLEYARKVCAAGKPAYVEKPPARNAAECREMVELFEAAKLPLFVAYYRRALPRFLKAKALVESGTLGAIQAVDFRYASPSHAGLPADGTRPWRLEAEHSGGGLFLDLGCHTLDIFDFIFGPLENVSGGALNLTRKYAVEEAVVMAFATPGGAHGVASWNFAGAEREDLITIIGTEGRLTMTTFGNEPLQLKKPHGLETFDLPNPAHIQQPLIQTIVDQLDGRGTCPSTGVSALRTARVMDAVLSDYYGGREDAFWTRPPTWPGSPSFVGQAPHA